MHAGATVLHTPASSIHTAARTYAHEVCVSWPCRAVCGISEPFSPAYSASRFHWHLLLCLEISLKAALSFELPLGQSLPAPICHPAHASPLKLPLCAHQGPATSHNPFLILTLLLLGLSGPFEIADRLATQFWGSLSSSGCHSRPPFPLSACRCCCSSYLLRATSPYPHPHLTHTCRHLPRRRPRGSLSPDCYSHASPASHGHTHIPNSTF